MLMFCNVSTGLPFCVFLKLIFERASFVLGHRFDKDTPIAETVRGCTMSEVYGRYTNQLTLFNSQMQALHDVVQAGYVRYIGMSSCWAWQCMCFCLC